MLADGRICVFLIQLAPNLSCVAVAVALQMVDAMYRQQELQDIDGTGATSYLGEQVSLQAVCRRPFQPQRIDDSRVVFGVCRRPANRAVVSVWRLQSGSESGNSLLLSCSRAVF